MIPPRMLEVLGHPQRLRVVQELKRTPAGLPVRALAGRMDLSYMRAKELCLMLEGQGILETWRDPVPNGRPQLLYRLSGKAHALFPTSGPELTLEVLQAAQRLFGAAAPEKLLRLAFQETGETWRAQASKGATVWMRAELLVKARCAAGCLSSLHQSAPGEVTMVEYHSPWRSFFQQYPFLPRLELELIQHALGTPVARTETAVAGQYQVIFTFAAEAAPIGTRGL